MIVLQSFKYVRQIIPNSTFSFLKPTQHSYPTQEPHFIICSKRILFSFFFTYIVFQHIHYNCACAVFPLIIQLNASNNIVVALRKTLRIFLANTQKLVFSYFTESPEMFLRIKFEIMFFLWQRAPETEKLLIKKPHYSHVVNIKH